MFSVLAVAYDLEVSKVGRNHLKTEPTIKKTTQFYHPKENKEKNIKADSKLPGFYLDNEPEQNRLSKSESFDQFNFWREPVLELDDLDVAEDSIKKSETLPNITDSAKDDASDFLTKLNKFLLKRPFISGFEVSSVDFAVMSLINCEELDENLHLNVVRWSQNIQSYDNITCDDVDLDKVTDFVVQNQDFTPEDVRFIDDEVDVDSNNDHGYDSDKENEVIDDEVEDDDEEGWITPGNLKTKKAAITNVEDKKQPDRVTVALMTTDFAMQNVCKQMGLNLIGTNGMIITETKTWILRCYQCFFTTPIMEKKFCPRCGYPTLKRVSVTLNEDGSQQIHISTRRPINTRGMKYSLPAPKGGKHAWNPRLTEDQREPQQRLSKKSMQRNNPMGEDYLAGNSPFVTRDVTSKAAMLGLGGTNRGNAQPTGFYWAQRNPNAVRKNTGNKKKK